MASTYELVQDFNRRNKGTVRWFRTRKHADLVDRSLNPNEKVLFAFVGQYDDSHGTLFDTAVLALTNDRVIVAQDRLILGYKVISITPDMFNDISIDAGLIWGFVTIDTIKEKIYFSNMSKKGLLEIKKMISSYMLEAKKKFYSQKNENS